MKIDEINIFIKLKIQLRELASEIETLSKKSPDGAINKFKLNFINHLLTQANTIVDEKNKPFPNFDTFDDSEMPTNSDVLVILQQYLTCLEKFRSENIEYKNYKWCWKVNNSKVLIETDHPSIKSTNYTEENNV